MESTQSYSCTVFEIAHGSFFIIETFARKGTLTDGYYKSKGKSSIVDSRTTLDNFSLIDDTNVTASSNQLDQAVVVKINIQQNTYLMVCLMAKSGNVAYPSSCQRPKEPKTIGPGVK